MAPAPQNHLSIAVLLFCCTLLCRGFNLDVRFPVVKEGPTKGSFFGLSVALHKQTQGSSRNLLLTGAPKEKAQPVLPNVNETGAVYFCPVTTDTSDCTRMNLISSIKPLEVLEGMWLGVTVASQRGQSDGRVLACGHRYAKVTSQDAWRMIGKCYVRGNDLTYNNTDQWQDFSYENCNYNTDMEEDGMCNMGISGGMTNTDVYVGSPGSYFWRGDAHVTWRNPNPAMSWDDNTKRFHSFAKFSYSYIGYSLLEDKMILDKLVDTVVTGAPRHDFKGCVILAMKNDNNLKPLIYIFGEQVGSYFGNSIATTDLDNDGWNDLIVGAPFYFDRKEEKGGAVYIFKNENGSFQKNATMVLWGPTDSGFGMAVAAIGDVNQDGFPDFAVGAPFHDSGRVYIWMGNQNLTFQNPSQIIEGNDVASGGFRTFGYSINGGMDVDGNGYPDVLVGSLDDRIALLRARPVIHLDKTFSVSPQIVDPSDCLLGEQPCVTVKVCFSYTLSNGNRNFKRNITVKYTVEADRDQRSFRIRFLENKQNIYTGFLSMPSTECQVLNLSLVGPVRDKLKPVVFLLNISLYEQTPKTLGDLQNLDAFPVLSEKQSTWEETEIDFLKDCGTDNKCTSNLQLTAKFANENLAPFPSQGDSQVLEYNTSVKKVVLMVNVTNLPTSGMLAEDAHQAQLNITIPPSLRYFGLRAMDQSIQCHSEENLVCDLGNPFSGGKMAELLIIFEASGITLYTRDIQAQLQLSTKSEQNDLKPVSVLLVVEFTIQTVFSVEPHERNTYFGGKVIGESAMNSTNDVGSPIEFTFTVRGVQGLPLGTMGALEVHFEWPYEVANGKWLLYLTEILTEGTSDTHCVPPGNVVNPLNLTLSNSGKKRLQREAVDTKVPSREPQAAITGKTSRQSYLLDCEKGTAHCEKFSCPLHNMSNIAKVIVRARVWNSTMLEDYADALRVEVKGKVTLTLVTNIPTIKMNSHSGQFTVNIDPMLREEKKYEIPLWIFILAALAGALLLGLIILILWKFGFFKRASYYRIMPKYHGVKICREERHQFNEGFVSEDQEKKHWVTSWTEMQRYYY
ncbi:integrin alpha-3 [Arapaima gigas]